MPTRKNIIYALIVLSLVLIILNISVEVSHQEEEIPIHVLSKKEIENKFAVALDNYGIANSWIKKTFVRHKLSDSLNYLFNISIPIDVTIASLIKDINSEFVLPLVEVETKERKNNSSSVLKIISNGVLKLQANLNHSKKVARKYAQYSFWVIKMFSEEESKNNVLKNIFLDYTYLLLPSKKTAEVLGGLNSNYAILLNDAINQTEFALKENFSKQKLINNIRSIIISFGKEKAYLIDEHSALFNSKIYSLIRDEFNSRGIKLHSLQKFPFIRGSSTEQLTSLFHFYTTSLKGKEGKIFIINADDFITLQPSISKQIKMGDKVVGVEF